MYWGGNLVENGDPKCPSRIKYGGGAVDESYFVDPKKAMADYDQLTTVYAGDKHLIQIKVKRPSRIRFVMGFCGGSNICKFSTCILKAYS